jgi:hypothetical protein
MSVYIGIDPGVNGALAWIVGASYPYVVKRKDLTQYDLIQAMNDLKLSAAHVEGDCFAIIEKQGAISKGRKACFELGASYAEWQMACLATGIGYNLITPTKWQRVVGLPAKKRDYAERKRALKTLAQHTYPNITSRITNDTCDAILIARFCQIAMHTNV